MAHQLIRTRSVTTKVTEAECRRLEEIASEKGVNLSEWVRGELLGANVLLGEVLALRTIVINLLFSLSNGDSITRESMQQLIQQADGEKAARAMEQLAFPATSVGG